MLDTAADTAATTTDGGDVVAATGPIRDPLGFVFWCCAGWLALLAIVSIFTPLLHLQNPILQQYAGIGSTPANAPNAGTNNVPSFHHLLGTDQLARDLLSRIIWGGRLSLQISLLATAIGITIGGGLGMLSAYFGGKFDAGLSSVMYVFLAFPAIVAVLAILTFWGRSELHIILVVGGFSIPLIFRLVRAATLSCASREYVTAATSQGATVGRIVLRELLPNILPSLIAYTVFTIGAVIAVEGALGFLGVGIILPTPTWGNILNEARGYPSNVSYVLSPSLVLFLTLLSLNYTGERIRSHFDSGEAKL